MDTNGKPDAHDEPFGYFILDGHTYYRDGNTDVHSYICEFPDCNRKSEAIANALRPPGPDTDVE